MHISYTRHLNALELHWAHQAILQEIDLAVQDQGNYTELSYALQGLTIKQILALLAHITELRASGGQVTYALLARAIGEEETDY